MKNVLLLVDVTQLYHNTRYKKKHKKILVPSNHILVENPTGVTDPSADRMRNGAGDMTLDLAQKQEWTKKFTSSVIFEKLNS